MPRNMTRLVGLVALLVSCGYHGPKELVPQPVKRAGEEVAEQASLLEVRDYLQHAFQPPPDRRFLLAVSDMAQLALGEASVKTTAVWQENAWVVHYGATPVGSLPPWPVFADYWQLLRSWADKLQPKVLATFKGGQARAGFREPAGNYLEQARELARQWQKKPSQKTLESAARLATVLAAHHLDLLETADEVPAHALALVALAEALGGEFHQERAVLALCLGYWPGDELLGKLEPQHPLVLFLNNKNHELDARVSRTSDALTVLFAAESLGERLLFSRAYSLAQKRHNEDPFALVWLRALGPQHEMSVARKLGWQALVSATAWARGRLPRAREQHPQEQLLRTFEKALASRSWPQGALFPRSWQQSFAKGLFASGVMILVDYAVEQFAEVSTAQELEKHLGSAKTPWGREVAQWVGHVVGTFLGKQDQSALLRALATPGALGGKAKMALFKQVDKTLAYGVPERLAAARVAFWALDNRPTHRELLVFLARAALLDLELGEKVAEELYRCCRLLFPGWVVFAKSIAGESSLLWQWVNDPTLAPRVRATAFVYLARMPDQPLPALAEAYESLWEAVPDPWNLAEAMARVLVGRGHAEKAVLVLQQACERMPRGGLEYAIARAFLAKVLLHMGKNQEALATVEEVVSSYQGGVLVTYVQALLSNGKKQEALEWAQKAWQRYPFSVYTLLAVMDAYWALGDYQAAAQALARYGYPISAKSWRFDVGPVFARRFRGRPQEAVAALKALGRKVEGEKLVTLAHECANRGDVALAFAVAERALWPPGRPDVVFEAYRYLRQLQGKNEAQKWLTSKLQVEPWNRVSYECWDSESYEVLWDLLPEEPQGDGAERVWVQRAAALAKGFDPGGKPRQYLLQKFSSPAVPTEATVVRYLLDLATPTEKETLLRTKMALRDGGELAYYLGLKAQGEGRCREAVRWYRVAIERLPFVSYQFRWAYSRLFAWWSWEASVDRACTLVGPQWVATEGTL